MTAEYTEVATYTSHGEYSFTVPAGVTKLKIEAWGAGGGGFTWPGGHAHAGGSGGYSVDPVVPVSPGEVLTVRVGEGGKACNSVRECGAAGGGSGVRRADGTLILVAGGGGGGGYSGKGGDGGGTSGQKGASSSSAFAQARRPVPRCASNLGPLPYQAHLWLRVASLALKLALETVEMATAAMASLVLVRTVGGTPPRLAQPLLMPRAAPRTYLVHSERDMGAVVTFSPLIPATVLVVEATTVVAPVVVPGTQPVGAEVQGT